MKELSCASSIRERDSRFFLLHRLPAMHRYSGLMEWYYTKLYPYIIPWVYAIGLTAQTGSIYCTLGVTVERYIVVCWPLR